MNNDLRDGQRALNYNYLVFSTSDSPVNGIAAEPVKPAAEQADLPSGE